MAIFCFWPLIPLICTGPLRNHSLNVLKVLILIFAGDTFLPQMASFGVVEKSSYRKAQFVMLEGTHIFPHL